MLAVWWLVVRWLVCWGVGIVFLTGPFPWRVGGLVCWCLVAYVHECVFAGGGCPWWFGALACSCGGGGLVLWWFVSGGWAVGVLV